MAAWKEAEFSAHILLHSPLRSSQNPPPSFSSELVSPDCFIGKGSVKSAQPRSYTASEALVPKLVNIRFNVGLDVTKLSENYRVRSGLIG